MQPSSLIFVVVIGIWAAFLIQYWVRRREHLATARSVDRFSQAMRVLDRRSPAVQTSAAADGSSDGPGIAAGSHAVSLAATSRPSSLLSGDGPRSPLVARGPEEKTRDVRLPRGRTSGATLRAARRGPSPAARRARTLGLILALAVVPVTVVAAALGFAPRWTIAVAFAAIGICLLALRLAAVRAHTARQTDRSMRSSTRSRSAGTRAFGHVGHRTPAAGRAARGRADVPERRPREGATVPDRRRQDRTESSSPARPPAGREPAPPAYRPGDPTWSPVPVPRPTYQLKDPAPPARRVRPPSQRPFDGQEPHQPAARSGSSRRVVSG